MTADRSARGAPVSPRGTLWLVEDDEVFAARLARALASEGCRVAAYLDLNPRRIGQRIDGVPVRRIEDVRDTLASDSFILAVIGGEGRRPGVRAYFESFGLREGEDWLCAA